MRTACRSVRRRPVSETADTAPRAELLRALAHLAEPPGSAHGPLAAALGLPEPPDAAGYTDLFEFQLYPYASVHLGAEGMLGGEAQGRVAGFWLAVGREVPPEPDHLASLIGLYVALGEEEVDLTERGAGLAPAGDEAAGRVHGRRDEPSGPVAQAALVARSRRALLEEHLAPRLFPFLVRVEELGGGFHAEWAKMLREAMAAEIDRHGPLTSPSAHLSAVEELPDPRTAGAKPFLAALLAPARAGAILTRADLARIARTLDLGLRAGERRYALEHLIGQDAPAILDALAAEVGRQGAGHQERSESIGRASELLAARAERTRALLSTLAREAETSEAAWADAEPASATPGPRNS